MSVEIKPTDMLGSIMTRDVVTVKPNDTVRRALQLMLKKDIGSLVIIDRGKPIGIVTERDFTRSCLRHSEGQSVYDMPVGKIMRRKLITATSKTPTWDAFELMLKNGIRRLPIVEEGKLVGMVTERDLFRWVVRVIYEPNIPEHVKRIIESK